MTYVSPAYLEKVAQFRLELKPRPFPGLDEKTDDSRDGQYSSQPDGRNSELGGSSRLTLQNRHHLILLMARCLLDDLERDSPLNRALLLGEKDDAHAAAAQFAQDLVRADLRGLLLAFLGLGKPLTDVFRIFEELIGVVVEERADLFKKVRIVAAFLAEEQATFGLG